MTVEQATQNSVVLQVHWSWQMAVSSPGQYGSDCNSPGAYPVKELGAHAEYIYTYNDKVYIHKASLSI